MKKVTQLIYLSLLLITALSCNQPLPEPNPLDQEHCQYDVYQSETGKCWFGLSCEYPDGRAGGFQGDFESYMGKRKLDNYIEEFVYYCDNIKNCPSCCDSIRNTFRFSHYGMKYDFLVIYESKDLLVIRQDSIDSRMNDYRALFDPAKIIHKPYLESYTKADALQYGYFNKEGVDFINALDTTFLEATYMDSRSITFNIVRPIEEVVVYLEGI